MCGPARAPFSYDTTPLLSFSSAFPFKLRLQANTHDACPHHPGGPYLPQNTGRRVITALPSFPLLWGRVTESVARVSDPSNLPCWAKAYPLDTTSVITKSCPFADSEIVTWYTYSFTITMSHTTVPATATATSSADCTACTSTFNLVSLAIIFRIGACIFNHAVILEDKHTTAVVTKTFSTLISNASASSVISSASFTGCLYVNTTVTWYPTSLIIETAVLILALYCHRLLWLGQPGHSQVLRGQAPASFPLSRSCCSVSMRCNLRLLVLLMALVCAPSLATSQTVSSSESPPSPTPLYPPSRPLPL